MLTFTKTSTGDGTSSVITIKGVRARQNSTHPRCWVRSAANPIMIPGGAAPQKRNIYSAEVLWNPTLHQYEMYYGGNDPDFPILGGDEIFRATGPTPFGPWAKATPVAALTPSYDPWGPEPWEDLHVNDPSVVHIPDWGITLMAYTGATEENREDEGIITFAHDSVCLAIAPLYGHTFTKYVHNPVLDLTNSATYDPVSYDYAENITIARPAMVYDSGVLHLWYDTGQMSVGHPEIRYSTWSYIAGVFTRLSDVLCNCASPENFGGIDVKRVGDRLFMSQQLWRFSTNMASATNLFSSTDGVNWTAEDDVRTMYGGAAPNEPIFDSGDGNGLRYSVTITPSFAFDRDGQLRGYYYSYSPYGYDVSKNQIRAMVLMRGCKVDAPAIYEAIDEDTLKITFNSGVPGTPVTFTVMDEDGATLMTTSPIAVVGGDVYSLVTFGFAGRPVMTSSTTDGGTISYVTTDPELRQYLVETNVDGEGWTAVRTEGAGSHTLAFTGLSVGLHSIRLRVTPLTGDTTPSVSSTMDLIVGVAGTSFINAEGSASPLTDSTGNPLVFFDSTGNQL